MFPLATTKLNYKPENFFPRINQEYRDFVRKGFLIEDIRYADKFSAQEYNEAAREIDPFDTEKPSFQFDDLDDVKRLTRDQKFDVISFLSPHVDHLVRCIGHGTDDNYNNHCQFVDVGVDESLKGKTFALLVCVFVPAKWCELNAHTLVSLSIVSSELSSRGDFEIVLVPVMRRRPDLTGFYGADAFDHFFTAFPNCLAVPVSSKRACELMCRKLDFIGGMKATLIGPNHDVLSTNALNIVCYGSAGYPFTLDRHLQLREELPQLSLASLLGCNPTTLLKKFGSSETISIDRLSTKLVGLYLFQRGDKFRAINEAYQKCLDKDRSNGVEPQFQIVLVCMPPCNSVHPFVFQEEALSILLELEPCKSWWVFPYNNSACCRLSKLSEDCPCDAMIIMDPSIGRADPYGGEILEYVGMDTYPFTREALVKIFVEKAEKVTLQSLLNCEAVDYVIRPDGQHMSVTDLLGKYVFLYVDRKLTSRFATEMLSEWYHAIKELHSESDFKFVFVQYQDDEDSCSTPVTHSGDIPWLVYPCGHVHSAFLRKHESFFMALSGNTIMTGLRPPVLLAFGEDGYIRLLDGRWHVIEYVTEPEPERKKIKDDKKPYPFLPSDKNLRWQVIQVLSRHMDFMFGYK